MGRVEVFEYYFKDKTVNSFQGLRIDEATGEIDEATEVMIVKDKKENEAKEIIIIPGYAKKVLYSPHRLAIMEAQIEIENEYKQKYGKENVEFFFVNSRCFGELIEGVDIGEMGEFVKTIDYSKIPMRVIRAKEKNTGLKKYLRMFKLKRKRGDKDIK